MNNPRSVPFAEAMAPMLNDDAFAVEFLNEALNEGMPEFLAAIGYLVDARNLKKTQLAKSTKMDRAGLHRILSGNGNPTLETLDSLLDSLGFKLTVDIKAAS